MANFNQRDQKITIPKNIIPIISMVTAIFGWVLVLFIILTSFSPLSKYLYFGQAAGWFIILLPGLDWLTAIVAGTIGLMQIKRKSAYTGAGLAKWGIAISAIGIALFYGFLLLVALGFYLALSKL